MWPDLDPDSMGAYYADQGMLSEIEGDYPRSSFVVCRYCGRVFEWEKIDGKWRLVTPSGRVHKCGKYQPRSEK